VTHKKGPPCEWAFPLWGWGLAADLFRPNPRQPLDRPRTLIRRLTGVAFALENRRLGGVRMRKRLFGEGGHPGGMPLNALLNLKPTIRGGQTRDVERIDSSTSRTGAKRSAYLGRAGFA
jgi:hypothetical protein